MPSIEIIERPLQSEDREQIEWFIDSIKKTVQSTPPRQIGILTRREIWMVMGFNIFAAVVVVLLCVHQHVWPHPSVLILAVIPLCVIIEQRVSKAQYDLQLAQHENMFRSLTTARQTTIRPADSWIRVHVKGPGADDLLDLFDVGEGRLVIHAVTCENYTNHEHHPTREMIKTQLIVTQTNLWHLHLKCENQTLPPAIRQIEWDNPSFDSDFHCWLMHHQVIDGTIETADMDLIRFFNSVQEKERAESEKYQKHAATA